MKNIKKNRKKGFTLVEILGVIVVLAIIILIATTAVIPAMNKAKKNALLNEARTYLKAAEDKYAFENEENATPYQCTTISELNSTYVKKSNDKYSGVVMSTNNDGKLINTIYLTDGKYSITGGENIKLRDVRKGISYEFQDSCQGYNSLHFPTNSLAYKIFRNSDGTRVQSGTVSDETILNAIRQRTSDIGLYSENSKPFLSGATIIGNGLILLDDDDGQTFTFYGKNILNKLSFGGMCWDIIRINGNGTIKIMYHGPLSGGRCSANPTYPISGGKLFNYTYLNYGQSSTKVVSSLPGSSSPNVTVTVYDQLTDISQIGYMVPTYDEVYTYPNFNLSNEHKLNEFILTGDVTPKLNGSSAMFYLFKNFNPNTDCDKGSGTQHSCTLKGTLDVDVTRSSVIASNKFSSAETGAYSDNDYNLNVYTDEYKYVCLTPSNLVTEGSNVYVTCRTVSEIMGADIKNGRIKSFAVRNIGYTHYGDTTNNINGKDSYVKTLVDEWYENNILNHSDGGSTPKILEEYLSDEVFCNDRSLLNEKVTETNELMDYNSQFYTPVITPNQYQLKFSAFKRIREDYRPSLKCQNMSVDGFTLGTSSSIVTRSGRGNGKLKYPVAIVTADEVMASGVTSAAYGNAGMSYMFNGNNLATMTPSQYMPNRFTPYLFIGNGRSNYYVYDDVDIVPVINLKADIQYVSGKGDANSPYTIKLPD